MRNLIVEISNREGVRIERVELTPNGLSIGRAWNSDLIIQDRFVDPDHLILSLDESHQVVISDIDSTNGTRLVGKHLAGTANPYRFGEVITIGDTQLRIFDAHESVEPAALRSNWFLLAKRFNNIKSLVVLTALALIVQAAMVYSRATKLLKVEDFLVGGFGLLMMLLVWSLLLGFIAKLLRGESNVKAFWVLGCLAIVVFNVASIVLLVLKFNLQDVNLGENLSILIFGILTVWLIVGVFSYSTYLRNRSKWTSALLLVSSLYAVAQSDEYLREPHQAWSSSTETEQSTLPPVFLLRDGVSLDDYLRATDSLFDSE